MKKFTSLIFLMFFALGFSQNAPVTFETGQQGANWSFSNFDNGPTPSVGFEKVTNPYKTGVNTSETVGKYTALSKNDLGGATAGCQSKHGTDLGTFKLTYSNCTVKIMVYKSVISDVGIKFAEADGGSTGEIRVKNTKINEWEELTFDFSKKIGDSKSGAIDQLILFMDMRDRTEQTVSYFDNITFSKSLIPPPVVACDAILKDAQQGSFTTGYKAKFETVGTNVNITFELLDQRDGLVVALWREFPFAEIPMDNVPAGSKIFTKTITGQTPGDVISYACRFAYAGGQSVTKYIKYEVGSYCDGIKPTAPSAAAPTPKPSASNVISLFSGGNYIDLVDTNWNPNWGQTTSYEEVNIANNPTKKYSNFNYQGVVLKGPIDISKMTKLHLDVWSSDCSALKVFLVPTAGPEKSVTVNLTLLGWNSVDINLADYTDMDLKSIKELKFESVQNGTTVFMDNIYFEKEVDASMSMNAPVTFETGEHGSSWNFSNFDNGTGTEGFEKVANPKISGINTSATVGKYTATVDGATWAGCKTNDIGKFTLDPNNSTVKIMVYKTVISDVALKFAVADGGSLGEIKVKNTKVNEWEELTFDFYNQIGKVQSTDIVTMMISLDYQARTQQNISYFDNITFSKTSVAPPVLICDAILKDAQQGSFTTGYKTKFETVGTDVNITFELLDQKDGVVAALWKESPFQEIPMVNEPAGSKIYKAKLSDQKAGSLISYACRFAYAGGQSVTKYIKYQVGTTCSTTPPVVTGPTLPLDFETGTFTFTDFDGGAVTIVDNPSKTGINTSTKVAKMVKGAGASWAGSYLKMASPIDFTTNKKLKVKVWSPIAGKKLLLKFEGAGAAFEKEVATTVANTWEELTFDYTGVGGVNNLNDKVVLIFDLGTAGDGSATSTYYFDEITQVTSTPPVVTGPKLPLDFETGTFAFVDFDGGAVTTVDNPQKAGINTSNKVAKMVKGAGAHWAGSKIKLASAVDFTTNKKIKVKVWSPVAGKKLLLKFEGAGAAFEKEVATTVANTWEELTFDYTGVNGVNNLNDNLVFIFDLGTSGDGSANSTYYFDEITQVTSTPPVVTGPTLPLDFETGTFAFVDFDGGAATTVDNPQKTGINTSNKVAKMVKGAGQIWGGSKLTLATPVDFSTKKLFKVKVWSPVAGKKLLLKFESPNGNFEKESSGVTTANTWEELTFDFTNVSTTNSASDIVFIFDLGKNGDGSVNSTYYFDDITQATGTVPATGATLPLDFEASNYAFVDFGGAVTTKIANPQVNGTNTSANVAQMVKGVGEVWAGSKIKMAAPINFTNDKLFKVKVWSPVSGKKLLLKFEGLGGSFETESTNSTVANAWEELTFDYTKVNTNNQADFMTFIFDFGKSGDGSANSTYLFDDVKQTSIPVEPSTNYLVSFEQGSVIGTWNSFENPGQTGFAFADNPSKTGINTSDKVGKFTAVPNGQRWAGCETASGTIGTWELDATSKTVTMMVYKSEISPVGIKMSTSYNGTTFEIKKKNTKINEWELMTFDISPFIFSADATKINKFVVFPDFREETDPARSKDVVFYFDDIKFSAKKLHDPNYVAPSVPNPTEAAPIPPVRLAADVKSIFSDAYTVYKAGNWCQCWGQSTVVSEVEVVVGDKIRKLENFTYQGVTLGDGEVFNVLDMNKVHIDIWFNDAKSISLALVQQTPGGSVESALKFTPSKEGWNSFDIDLNATTLPGVDLSKVFQMKLTSEKQGSNVFIDNLYFWRDASSALAQMDLPVTFDDSKVDYALLGFGGTEGSSIVKDPTLDTNKVAKVFKPADSKTWAGVTISAPAALGFKNPIPFSTSATKMSVRVWSPDAGTVIRLKVEDHANKDRSVETEAIVTTAKGWETVVFDFAKQVTGTAAINYSYKYDKATIFFGFGSTGAEKTYYFDDVKMVEVALKPELTYGVAAQTYVKGKAIFPLEMVNKGGIVPTNGYSISPELPTGLSFNSSTATISGTPTTVSAPKLYTITGTNASGAATTTVTLNVVEEILASNFTIQSISESCLGQNNGEIRISSADSRTYEVTVNGKTYELKNNLRIFDLKPGVYPVKINLKGENTAQEFIVEIGKGGTMSIKTNKLANNKIEVEMLEGTAPYKIVLNGVEQFETLHTVFEVDAKNGGKLEILTAKSCEGIYATNIEALIQTYAAFPNPTTGSFEIAIPTDEKEVQVDILSSFGQVISSKSYTVENGTVKLSLQGQSNGIYFARVNSTIPSNIKIIKK